MKRDIILIVLAALLGCLNLSAKDKKDTQAFVHPWTGKRIAYIGDSVTDPNHGGGRVKHYWNFLSEWLESEAYVYAVSGHTWTQATGHIDKLNREHGQEVDVILFFLGTNDFNASVPIGKWYSEELTEVERAAGYPRRTETLMQRKLNYDGATVCGRINTAMLKVKQLYPTKQVVLLTPIHRGYAKFGGDNIQPEETFPNELGLYIDDYIRAVREAGELWSIPVIDLFTLSGLQPLVPEQLIYFLNPEEDRLHPNTQGHERMAKTLLYQSMTLPVF